MEGEKKKKDKTKGLRKSLVRFLGVSFDSHHRKEKGQARERDWITQHVH